MALRKALHPRRVLQISLELLKTLKEKRALVFEQARRELVDQHAGHAFGGAWVVVHPLFIMLVYVFIFAVVFKARAGGTRELPLDYTSYILCGLGPWLAIVQSLSKSASALTGSANLIKQVVFPVEVLPIKSALSTLVPLLVMLGVYFGYTVGFQHQVFWTQLLLPVLILIYVLWTTGLALLLASVTVFVRDVRELVQLSTIVGVFMCPIIYLPQWVPAVFKPILYLNPFSYIIWCFQDALYYGRFEHPWAWFVSIFGGLFVFALGARVFRSLKPFFGDAL